MNVRFLEAFVWVSKLGSFKGAADKLHTTQAGISSRIATLEGQFGVRLFEREHRAVRLTHQGSQLLPYAERMIELQTRMLGAVGEPEHLSGILRIGVIETVVHTWLPELLTRFAERYPNVTLELESDITPRLRDDLLRGVLDCTVTSEEMTPGFVENRRIATFSMRWIASAAMAAGLPPGRIPFAEIARHPIISFHRESSVYRNIAQHAGACEADMRISYFSSMGAMVGLVRSGFGIALLPLAVVQDDLANGSLVLLDVDPLPAPLPLVASARMEPASPLADALMALADSTCQAFMQRCRSDAFVG